LTAVPAPPYAAYASNANHVTALANPLATSQFRDRWYGQRCAER
jgi:hypothetical protein